MTTTPTNTIDMASARIGTRLLGAVLREPALMGTLVNSGITSADFVTPMTVRLWNIMLTQWRDRHEVVPSLVQDSLEALYDDESAVAMAADDIEYCTLQPAIRLAEELPSLLEHLRSRAALRKLEALSNDLGNLVEQPGANPVQIAEGIRSVLESVLVGASAMRCADGAELAAYGEHLLDVGEPPESRVSLGLPIIDDLLGGGAVRGEPTVIGAGTGIGKSTFATHFSLRAIQDGHRVLWFSFEANRGKVSRLICQMHSGFPYPRQGEKPTRTQASTLSATHAWLADQPIFVDDSSGVDVETLRARVELYIHVHGVNVVLVDYVQSVMRSTRYGRDDLNFAHISESLRRLSNDHNLALLELSQVRELEKGEDRLTAEHTAFSQQFARDANAVVMLERDRYSKDESKRHVTRVGLVKNRFNGQLGDEFVRYDHRTHRLVSCTSTGERSANVVIKPSTGLGTAPYVADDYTQAWDNDDA